MPNTEYDDNPGYHKQYHDLPEHAHYIGTINPRYLSFRLAHGDLVTRTYNYRGDWYAVHTH